MKLAKYWYARSGSEDTAFPDQDSAREGARILSLQEEGDIQVIFGQDTIIYATYRSGSEV
jgi:hypothetical protein